MAKLEVLKFPDERLRTIAKPVEEVNDEIRQIVKDMLETMYDENGVGLAATQVDIHQRIVVIDVSEERNEPYVLINPEIIASEGNMVCEEGCLSVPYSYAKVDRAEKVTVKALNEHGEEYQFDAQELLSNCVQHELDHLVGKLFIDYLSPLKRQRIKKKIEKEARLAAKA
ncbi:MULTISPECIES: peptide deformylase [Pseudoalteromonas]|uniref:Peptide deformylase n=1 Tax=Pseudoalteromonas luteoviolacea (strain 2ta16) TaxID=1353533 RepID=V4J8Q0_PSEL2|nr:MULTISPECIES: peptide deformylase [Pseudoalteromonas]ESP91617.1 peptide deformylase [Pseudoalteromonas luteoviolacea 2ta16]KZN39229.1 peptide deformylase [Pseudoalteromonas luteoviolacea NCIMB 1944]MCG7551141.1 peptide deformylase [Pseudoalteromonas sp. Of7M-16]